MNADLLWGYGGSSEFAMGTLFRAPRLTDGIQWGPSRCISFDMTRFPALKRRIYGGIA